MNQIFNDIGKTFSDDFFGPSLITNFFSDPYFNNNLINNRTHPNNNFRSYNNYQPNNDPNQPYNNINNLNQDYRFIDPIGIPGVFGLSFGYNPVFDEFLDVVNNNFNPEFARNYYQQRGYPGNQNFNANNAENRNYNYNDNNFQQHPQQNVNYRDTKIYDV